MLFQKLSNTDCTTGCAINVCNSVINLAKIMIGKRGRQERLVAATGLGILGTLYVKHLYRNDSFVADCLIFRELITQLCSVAEY